MSIFVKVNKCCSIKLFFCDLINVFEDWVKFIFIGICFIDYTICFRGNIELLVVIKDIDFFFRF